MPNTVNGDNTAKRLQRVVDIFNRVQAARSAVEESWACPLCGGPMELTHSLNASMDEHMLLNAECTSCGLGYRGLILVSREPEMPVDVIFAEFDRLNGGGWKWRRDSGKV